MFRLLAEARATLLHHAYKRQEYDDHYEQYLAHLEKQWMQQKRANAAQAGGRASAAAVGSALVFLGSFTPPSVDLVADAQEFGSVTGSSSNRSASQRVPPGRRSNVPPTHSPTRDAAMPVGKGEQMKTTDATTTAAIDEVEVDVEPDDGEWHALGDHREESHAEATSASPSTAIGDSESLGGPSSSWSWIAFLLTFLLQAALEFAGTFAMAVLLRERVISKTPSDVVEVLVFGAALLSPCAVSLCVVGSPWSRVLASGLLRLGAIVCLSRMAP
jgi:hypothetical protein